MREAVSDWKAYPFVWVLLLMLGGFPRSQTSALSEEPTNIGGGGVRPAILNDNLLMLGLERAELLSLEGMKEPALPAYLFRAVLPGAAAQKKNLQVAEGELLPMCQNCTTLHPSQEGSSWITSILSLHISAHLHVCCACL